MLVRVLVTLAFVIASLAFSATPAVGCSCQHGPTDRAAIAEIAELVFTAIARAYGTHYPVERAIAVEFQVGTVYKGVVAPRLQVQAIGGNGLSGGLGPGCEYGFQLGRQYTVFAIDHDSDGVPNTNGCFWNVEGPIAASAYGLAAGRTPEVDSEAQQLALVALVALAVLAATSMAWRPRPLSP